MTRIAWCSIDALSEALAVYNPDVVVSISSPRHLIQPIEDRVHMQLVFHDLEERSLRTCGKIVPDHRHVAALLELIEDHRPQRLLCQCVAGLSRSPAFAIVAAVRAGCAPTETCRQIHRLVPHAQPNRLILSLADEVLGTDMLAAAIATFRYDRGHDHPTGDRAPLCEITTTANRVEVRQ